MANAQSLDNLADQPLTILEPGVTERGKDQLAQGGRGYYDDAFDGSTPLGALKGNRSSLPDTPARPLTDGLPFKNLRGGNR